MATPSHELVQALRRTAQRLEGGAAFSWGHQGRCHCGHLAQTLTGRDPAELHRELVATAGDWRDHVLDHCPASGLPVDRLLDAMIAAGLDAQDVARLETLSDPAVVRGMALGRPCDHRSRADSIRYFHAWADVLEAALVRPCEGPEPASRTCNLLPTTVFGAAS